MVFILIFRVWNSSKMTTVLKLETLRIANQRMTLKQSTERILMDLRTALRVRGVTLLEIPYIFVAVPDIVGGEAVLEKAATYESFAELFA